MAETLHHRRVSEPPRLAEAGFAVRRRPSIRDRNRSLDHDADVRGWRRHMGSRRSRDLIAELTDQGHQVGLDREVDRERENPHASARHRLLDRVAVTESVRRLLGRHRQPAPRERDDHARLTAARHVSQLGQRGRCERAAATLGQRQRCVDETERESPDGDDRSGRQGPIVHQRVDGERREAWDGAPRDR